MAKYKIIPSSRTIVQSPISIGHKAEKGVEAIEFDVTAWVETYGSGTLTVIMRRWGDAIPYPIALEIDENNKATWTLSDTDTAKAGMAYAQLSYIVGDEVVKKSDIYTFRVMDSLTGEGDPPEAYESWLENLTHLAAEAMAEVLDIEGIVTDKTLTVDGGIADAKATGDALSALEDQFTEETDQLKADLDTLSDEVHSGSGMTDDIKQALFDCISHIGSWTTGEASDYIDALEMAFFPHNPYIYTLTSDDLELKRNANTAPDYSNLDSTRLSYTKFDLLLSGGKTYRFKATSSVNTANMGLQFYTDEALTAVSAGQDLNNYLMIYDPGWQPLDATLNVPAQKNGHDIVGLRITFRKNESSETISDVFISKITIEEVTK